MTDPESKVTVVRRTSTSIGASRSSSQSSSQWMNSIEKLQQTERKLRDSYIDCSHSCELDTLALGRAIRDGNSATTTELINRLKGLVTAKFTSRIESFLLDFKSLFLEFSGSSPRACVKIAHSGSQDEGVVTLVCRDTPRGYSTSYRISEHTGFAQVNFTMEAYLENNIPNNVVDNLYNNPCLSGCHPYPLHLGCSQFPE